MYKNLQILMISNNVSEETLATTLGLSLKAIQHRFKGNTEFKRSEMLIVKKKLFPSYTLDQLFDDDIKILET